MQSRSIEIFGLCLDSFLTNSLSIEKLSVCAIDAQQLFNSSRLAYAQQLLDLSRSSCMHCFSHVLHLSFILSSIASCFITFMHLYRFVVPLWSSLIIFMFLEWSFLASCTLYNFSPFLSWNFLVLWQKEGEIVVSF